MKKKEMRKSILLLIVIFCISFFISCKPNPVTIKTQSALGTVCTIQLFEYGTADLYNRLFNRLDEIEQLMSVSILSSQISHINKAAGEFPVEVSPDTFWLIGRSLDFANESKGAFEPSIGPLVNLWNITGFNVQTDTIPSHQIVNDAAVKCDYKKVRLNQEKNTVFLEEKGMALDLGGIAKGWAADEIVRILLDNNVPYGIINLGGNVWAYGKKEDSKSWNIGIKNPFDSYADPVMSIKIVNMSVVTSGVYERFFEKDGIMYHHILDAKTGYPVENELVSVTIVHESSMEADALSTMIFVMGREDGLQYLNEKKIKGILITKNYEMYASENILESVKILDSNFTLMQ